MSLEPMTRELCNRLIDGFIGTGHADAAVGYAQQVPVRVIANILGVRAGAAIQGVLTLVKVAALVGMIAVVGAP